MARKILAARERRARNWKTARWLCLVGAGLALGIAIFALHTGYRLSMDHYQMLQNASRKDELTSPATIADIERLRSDIALSLVTVTGRALCYTKGLLWSIIAVWFFLYTRSKWHRHDEDALAAKLLHWILDEEKQT